ncbi:CHAP domain-containing protein [Calidifontibacter sp. DB0510]|uniref:CHAP domain-containing protein n=1 Tax=Metallococcus carri TaxID=1656884 RepID=A0A967B696_9MICO|nr:CHAP domain-containing protein [Metallococcus carri]NHN55451.1 CHAP domain-containing protein [Metallococcus carri]NOP38365.1 CHAP domain-containing protein [Calidifontibacter sp. DB2511S]
MKNLKRTLALGAAGTTMLAGGVVGIGVATSQAANGTVHTASAPLTVRAKATTHSKAVGTLKKGAKVTIVCQARGQRVTGTYGSSTWWDKIGNGRWVSDAYVYTGSNTRVAPLCKGAKNPPPATNPGGVKRTWGQTIGHNTGSGGQCTWGAYEKFKAYSGKYPLVMGNAKDMARNAKARGWTVTYKPYAHSMVVFQPGVHGANRTYGHVAWVKAVHGNKIDIVEMNFRGEWVWSTRTVTDVSGMQYILAPAKR